VTRVAQKYAKTREHLRQARSDGRRTISGCGPPKQNLDIQPTVLCSLFIHRKVKPNKKKIFFQGIGHSRWESDGEFWFCDGYYKFFYPLGDLKLFGGVKISKTNYW